MGKRMGIMFSLVVAISGLLFTGCVSVDSAQIEQQKVGVYSVPLQFKTEQFQIKIGKMYNGSYAESYFCEAIVKNIGTEEAEFDPSVFELENEEGITFYYATADENQSREINMQDLITKISLKAGKAIEGRFYFPTTMGKANDPKLVLTYKGMKQETVREKFLSNRKEFTEYFNM